MDFSVSSLPLVNALLNSLATVLLVCGYVAIRRGKIQVHRALMLSAFGTSVLFLVSYLIYHYHAGSKPYPGTGALRVIYLTILATHIPLAALIVPLALLTAFRGLRSQFDRHVRIAVWTFPIWLYVSVTGVVIYLMLYQL